MIYFDSNYLTRCYVTEAGSEEVRKLATMQKIIACCEYGRIELGSALHRKLREGHITATHYKVIQKQMELDERNGIWTWLSVTSNLLKKASAFFHKIPSTVFIRAGDILHLACAAENGIGDIYSNDRHLRAAAHHFGLNARDVISKT